MKIEGERTKLFRIFVSDINGEPIGDPLFETDDKAEALAFRGNAGGRYLYCFRRRYMSKTEFEQST